MFARYSDLLPLKAAEETDTIISSRAVLSTTLLLALPLEDESRIAERG